jgi:hypothetical protein
MLTSGFVPGYGLGHQPTRGMEARVRGLQRAAYRLGDLLHGKVLDFVEDEDRPLVIVHAVEDAGQELDRLASVDLVNLLGRLNRHGRLGLEHLAPNVRAPSVLGSHSDTDSVDPGPERGVSAEIAKSTVGNQEDVLTGVLHVSLTHSQVAERAPRELTVILDDTAYRGLHWGRRRVARRITFGIHE